MSERSNPEEMKKLRWRSRRGILELDLMLVRYLERCYLDAASDEQQTFRALLELEDSDLLRYLLGEKLPEAAELNRLVQKIRGLPV